MQIKKTLDLPTPSNKFETGLVQSLLSFIFDLANVINGGLKFSDNFNCQIVSVTDTGLADAEFAVGHGLKRVPTGFIVINNNKAGVVYDSGTAWTTTYIYLKCSALNATIKIILI